MAANNNAFALPPGINSMMANIFQSMATPEGVNNMMGMVFGMAQSDAFSEVKASLANGAPLNMQSMNRFIQGEEMKKFANTIGMRMGEREIAVDKKVLGRIRSYIREPTGDLSPHYSLQIMPLDEPSTIVQDGKFILKPYERAISMAYDEEDKDDEFMRLNLHRDDYARAYHNATSAFEFCNTFFHRIQQDIPNQISRYSGLNPLFDVAHSVSRKYINDYLLDPISDIVMQYIGVEILVYNSAPPMVQDEIISCALSDNAQEVYYIDSRVFKAAIYYLHRNPGVIESVPPVVKTLGSKLAITPYITLGGHMLVWAIESKETSFYVDVIPMVPTDNETWDHALISSSHATINAVYKDKTYICSEAMIQQFVKDGARAIQEWEDVNTMKRRKRIHKAHSKVGVAVD